MKYRIIFLASILFYFISTARAQQLPELPPGKLANWKVNDPVELVQWLAFDTAAFSSYLPDSLRYITIKDGADRGHQQSIELINAKPNIGSKGVLLFEIIRYKTFVDGKSPESGEIVTAVMIAGVTPRKGVKSYKQGRMMINSWSDDSTFVKYINSKGFYRNHGDVYYKDNIDEPVVAKFNNSDVNITMKCKPAGNAKAYPPSLNVVYYPKGKQGSNVLVNSLAGHLIDYCINPVWEINGLQKFEKLEPVGPMQYQFGYDLNGGVYKLSDFVKIKNNN